MLGVTTGQPRGSSELGAGRNHPPKAGVCHTRLESFHTCAFLQTQGTRKDSSFFPLDLLPLSDGFVTCQEPRDK